MNSSSLFACALAGALAVGGSAGRAQTSLSVLAASPSQLKIDGDVGEWRGARFVRVGEGAGGSAEVALAYDATGLYVGARVRDDAFVRSARPSSAEDALVVRLAFPSRGEFVDNDVWLFAGRIGETAASVQLRPGAAGSGRPVSKGVKIVEGPSPGGYALEAFLPWTTFEGGADWAFARGSLRLHDVDPRGGRGRDESTAPVSLTAAKLPWLALDGGPILALSNFLRAKNLEATASKLDFVGDVRGDARAERVLVAGTFVAVSGNGAAFTFTELPVNAAADVLSAELRDLTGDGKPELLVRLRQQNDLGQRELLTVYGLWSETPLAVFGLELRKQTSAGVALATLKFERDARGPTQIVVGQGRVQGLTPETWREAPAGMEVGIPLPWGPWRERAYGWDGSRFAVTRERANDAARPAPAPPLTAGQVTSSAAPKAAAEVSLSPTAGTALEAYKRARHVGAEVPARYTQTANVMGDQRTESVAVFGRELVVTGEGVAGAGFFFVGLPVADAADVLGVQTSDLTGDGRRELLVRIQQRIGDVQRQLVYCYSLAAERVDQLLAVEVSRARGAQRIDNKLALVADKQSAVLTIEPGVSRGWSAADYPFVAESLDGVAPLLLPWKDHTTRYVFERDRLVAKTPTNN